MDSIFLEISLLLKSYLIGIVCAADCEGWNKIGIQTILANEINSKILIVNDVEDA